MCELLLESNKIMPFWWNVNKHAFLGFQNIQLSSFFYDLLLIFRRLAILFILKTLNETTAHCLLEPEPGFEAAQWSFYSIRNLSQLNQWRNLVEKINICSNLSIQFVNKGDIHELLIKKCITKSLSLIFSWLFLTYFALHLTLWRLQYLLIRIPHNHAGVA